MGGNITGIDFKSAGSISLLDARIKGILNWQHGTEICYKEGVAFQADRIRSRGIYLRNGFKTDGEISILGAIIDGSLICTGGKFFDISAQNISVNGDVLLDAQSSNPDNYFQSVGKVVLSSSKINGSLKCSGGEFVDIDAENISVEGDIELNRVQKRNFQSTGKILLSNANVNGTLLCIRGIFYNPDDFAIEAEHLIVKNIYLVGSGVAGHINFYGSKTGGTFRISDMIWRDSSRLSLDQVSTKTLLEKMNGWPQKNNLSLLGFTYEFIDSRSEQETSILNVKNALHWIGLVENFHPQPYEQLASVFIKSGLEKEAHEIQIAKNKLLDGKEKRKLVKMLELEDEYDACEFSSEIIHTKPQIFKSHTELWDCIFYLFKRFFFGAIIGYGYRVKRLLPIFLYLFLSSSCFFYWAGSESHNIMTSSQKTLRSSEDVYSSDLPGTPEWTGKHTEGDDLTLAQIISDNYPHFRPCVYSLDIIIPLVDLGQEEYWMPNHNNDWGKWVYFFVVFLKLSGWGISTLLVYAVTGLIRR
ncbi:MAG: hypothetical protein D3922_08200 [Candidatus Electrothrix sp. AR1]|nr:hypothetical protein [Candidatus Electrothrix sp. AR1]